MDKAAYFAVRGALRFAAAQPHIRCRPFHRALQTSARRNNNDYPKTPSLQTLRRLHAAQPVPLRAAWPWHTVSSTPDSVILERTIFARPSDLPPPLLLFAAGVWGLFIVTYFALPDPRKRELTVAEQEKMRILEQEFNEAGFFARLGNRLAGSVYIAAQPLLMGGVTLVLAGFLLGATRIVTRLSLVQVRSAAQGVQAGAVATTGDAASAPTRTYLQLTSVGHEMWRGVFKPRQLDIRECKAYLLSANRATTIRLQVLDPNGQPKKTSLDRFPYSLDFREYNGATGSTADVVLSKNRLENVFGQLRQGLV